jgi:rhodanese-related sulfurtransferase
MRYSTEGAHAMLTEAQEVCPTTTLRMSREGAVLVDVREREEIDSLAFDVPDLVVMPMSEFERRCAELPRDRDLVMVCRVGERSLKATYYLMYRGYTRVTNMEGGIAKWARKGFPVKGNASAAIASAATGCCGGAAQVTSSGGESTRAAGESCCAPQPTRSSACC